MTIYLSGAGNTNPPSQDGQVNRLPAAAPATPVTLRFIDDTYTVTFAGAAPGLVAGILQVNFIAPQASAANVKCECFRRPDLLPFVCEVSANCVVASSRICAWQHSPEIRSKIAIRTGTHSGRARSPNSFYIEKVRFELQAEYPDTGVRVRLIHTAHGMICRFLAGGGILRAQCGSRAVAFAPPYRSGPYPGWSSWILRMPNTKSRKDMHHAEKSPTCLPNIGRSAACGAFQNQKNYPGRFRFALTIIISGQNCPAIS